MKKLNFTPGPWKVERRTTPGQFVTAIHIVSKDESHIAEVGPCLIDQNAKLIAKAPDMYKTLHNILKYDDDIKPEFCMAQSLRLEIENLIFSINE